MTRGILSYAGKIFLGDRRKMKKILIFILTAVFFSGCGVSSRVTKEDTLSVQPGRPAEGVYKGVRRRVAVAEFSNKTAYGQRLGTAASDILVTELNKTGNFILIERERLDKVIQEQKLSLAGIIDNRTAASVGNLLGAGAIVTGSITDFGVKTESGGMLITQGKKQTSSCTVDVRVVDVATGRIIFAESGKGTAERSSGTFLGMGSKSGYDETLEGASLRAAIVKLTENIAEQINSSCIWACNIAEITQERIYIDAGKASGLEQGTVLDVFLPGKEIVSPSTGLVLGREQKKTGRVKVLEMFGEDAAIVKLIEGNAEKGDICKINEEKK